jgi:hypothetical protein
MKGTKDVDEQFVKQLSKYEDFFGEENHNPQRTQEFVDAFLKDSGLNINKMSEEQKSHHIRELMRKDSRFKPFQKKRNFDEYSSIAIRTEDITKLSNWYYGFYKNANDEQHFEMMFGISEGVVRLDVEDSVYFKLLSEDCLLLEVYSDGLYYGYVNVENGQVDVYSNLDKKLYREDTYHDVIASKALTTFIVFAYMNHYKDDASVLMVEERYAKDKKARHGKSNSKKKRVTYIHKQKYTIQYVDLDKIKEIEREKREIQRHIDSWSVRGHWRVMKKSGKRVWVKEHNKGNGAVEKKNYKVVID